MFCVQVLVEACNLDNCKILALKWKESKLNNGTKIANHWALVFSMLVIDDKCPYFNIKTTSMPY